MNKRLQVISVTLFLSLVAVVSGYGQVLKADYQFQGNLNSSVAGAPPMTNLTGGGANSFATDVIDGYTRPTLRFPSNSGLAVSIAGGLIPNTSYTIVILFRFDQVSGFRRIASFDNRLTDNGAYIQDGRLEFENTANPPFDPNTYIQVAIVRDASGTIRGYRDGILRVNQNDGGTFEISGANVLSFFQDDIEFPGEASAGNVARVRLYDAPMTTVQVQALDRLQVANVSPTAGIAFSSGRDGDFEIYSMDADGSRQYRLTNSPGFDGYPDWSPNGSKIAFYSTRDGNSEIYSMNADGSNQTRLTNDPGTDLEPVWSPDGGKIAFSSNRDGDSEIYVLDLASGNTSQITNNAFLDSRPTWSPSGGQIAFQTDREGDVEIFKMDANGSNPVQLTFNTAGEGQPAWSPDGMKIAFWSQRDGPMTEIYTMNADGSNQVRLTNNTVEDAKPSWSPDSNKLTYGTRPGPLSQIYTMNADGTNQTRLTVNSASDQWSDWRSASPTGGNLALNRPTIQSSNYSQGGGDSSHAVDGNTNGNYFQGSVTATNLDTQAWWQVDLESIGSIESINVWNRTDCCADRLTNFYVLVSDVPFVSNDLTTVLKQPGVSSFLTPGQGGRPTSIAMGRSGRYVRVQLVGNNYLSLAEVEVLGPAGSNCTPIPISYGQSINGTLNASSCIANGPTDRYTFAGTTGQQIAISLDAFPGGFQPLLQLVDPTGTIVLASNSGTTNARIPASSGFFPLPSNGTYTIVASSPLGTFGGYALTLSLQPVTACNYTVSPLQTNVIPSGGTYFFDVLSGVDCPTVTAATGANSEHIQIISNIGGRVTFNVSAHEGTADRMGTIVAGGQTHTVTQFGTAPPTNDFFAQAQILPGMSGTVNGRNTNATAEPNEPAHAGSPAARSVWYRWTAPAEGLYSFTTSGSDFDTVMAVYTGASVGALTPIAENDDTTSFDPTSKINFRASQGVEYYIAVDGKNGASGSIQLSYSRYSRLFRLYLQTFNGVTSPITPTSVIARRQDMTGSAIPGEFVSLGVYEFDLPDDNSPYVVTIDGPDGITWSPPTYVIDNASARFDEFMNGAPGGGQNQTSNPTNTIPRRFKGYITGITTQQQLSSLRVRLASIGSSSAVPPVDCPNPELVTHAVLGVVARYDCRTQPQTTHQVVPNAPQTAFQVPVLSLPVINIDTGPAAVAPYLMSSSTSPTYNISGRVGWWTRSGECACGHQIGLIFDEGNERHWG